MTTAAAYIRKSNDQQDRTDDVKSVATQRDLVAAFAAAHGWTLDEQHVFADDGITGALFAERPGLQALLTETRTAPVPFSKLIVVEQSRLGRTCSPMTDVSSRVQPRAAAKAVTRSRCVATLLTSSVRSC